ncbi:MAG: hypothetical protein AB8E82_19765 [Aureispira sp.]
MTIKTNPNLFLTALVSFSLFLGACNNTPSTTTDTEESYTSSVQENTTKVQKNETNISTDNPTTIGTAQAFTSTENQAITSALGNILAVAPPIAGVDVPYHDYTINAAQGKLIVTPTGSRIAIPANAFVDQAGNPIKGEVTIKYREFHAAEDIIASGIPMHDPETGAYMQTAGMFEIKGNQNGEEIFMTANKPVQVDMNSQVAGNDYNFYQLGAKDCRWKDKGSKPAQPNTYKQVTLKKLDAALKQTLEGKPKFVKNNQTNNFVFDLQVDYKRQPELKTFKNVIWEYTGQGKDPEQNEWVFESQWDGVDIKPLDNGYYEMLFSGPNKKFSTTVRPVLSDKDYDKALANFNKKNRAAYEQAKEQQAALRTGLEAQGDLVRSFQVNNFGIYNWDIWKRDNRRRCVMAPKFDLLAQKAFEKTGSKNVQYFLVTNDYRSVVRYYDGNLDKFSYNPAEKNMLLAILPNGQAAVVKNNAFMDFDKQFNKKKWNVELATTGQVISSVEDLKYLIGAIDS